MSRPAAHSSLLRWLPAAAYAGLIAFLSSRPGLQLPAAVSDKAAHAVEFALLGGLVWWALGGAPGARRLATTLGIVAAYAVLDEFHQSFVPGRDASAWDVAADLAGASLAVSALGLAAFLRRRAGRGGTGPELTLLSRSGCRLCDEAEEVLRRVQAEIHFTYTKLDVDGDESLARAHGYDVPVLLLGGRKVFKHRIDPDRLRRRLLRAGSEVVSS